MQMKAWLIGAIGQDVLLERVVAELMIHQSVAVPHRRDRMYLRNSGHFLVPEGFCELRFCLPGIGEVLS